MVVSIGALTLAGSRALADEPAKDSATQDRQARERLIREIDETIQRNVEGVRAAEAAGDKVRAERLRGLIEQGRDLVEKISKDQPVEGARPAERTRPSDARNGDTAAEGDSGPDPEQAKQFRENYQKIRELREKYKDLMAAGKDEEARKVRDELQEMRKQFADQFPQRGRPGAEPGRDRGPGNEGSSRPDGGRVIDFLPKGSRIVSVQVKDTDGVDKLLPGDHVDVRAYAQHKGAEDPSRAATETLLRNVIVYAVSAEIHRENVDTSKAGAKTIALLVTAEQASMVTQAAESGAIRLSKRVEASERETATAPQDSGRDGRLRDGNSQVGPSRWDGRMMRGPEARVYQIRMAARLLDMAGFPDDAKHVRELAQKIPQESPPPEGPRSEHRDGQRPDGDTRGDRGPAEAAPDGDRPHGDRSAPPRDARGPDGPAQMEELRGKVEQLQQQLRRIQEELKRTNDSAERRLPKDASIDDKLPNELKPFDLTVPPDKEPGPLIKRPRPPRDTSHDVEHEGKHAKDSAERRPPEEITFDFLVMQLGDSKATCNVAEVVFEGPQLHGKFKTRPLKPTTAKDAASTSATPATAVDEDRYPLDFSLYLPPTTGYKFAQLLFERGVVVKLDKGPNESK